MVSTGFCIGRFQHFHLLHESLVRPGLTLCDKFLVIVGSAGIIPNERNPFPINLRIELIQTIFSNEVRSGKLMIMPLADLTTEDDISEAWGNYLLTAAKCFLGDTPGMFISGNDERRGEWFNQNTIPYTHQLIVPRPPGVHASATDLRKMLIDNNESEWRKHTNPKIHHYYNILRKEVLRLRFAS